MLCRHGNGNGHDGVGVGVAPDGYDGYGRRRKVGNGDALPGPGDSLCRRPFRLHHCLHDRLDDGLRPRAVVAVSLAILARLEGNDAVFWLWRAASSTRQKFCLRKGGYGRDEYRDSSGERNGRLHGGEGQSSGWCIYMIGSGQKCDGSDFGRNVLRFSRRCMEEECGKPNAWRGATVLSGGNESIVAVAGN